MDLPDLRGQEHDAAAVNAWITFGTRIAVSAVFHPLEYVKVLMQLGYEPIAPRPGRSIFGSPRLILPNAFEYANYIRRVDGLVGCYRGLTPKMVGIFVSSFGSEKIALKLGFPKTEEDKKHESNLSDEESDKRFLAELKRDVVVSISTITLSYPFQVISLRMMAQFIGNETTYKTIWSSIKEIWNTEGIFGFFSGFVPRLLCELSCLVLASSATHFIKKHIIHDRDEKNYVLTLTSFFAANIFYPLHVVSTCMTVTGSRSRNVHRNMLNWRDVVFATKKAERVILKFHRLKAGQPPHMPIYVNWTQCWRELKATGGAKRGNSMFFRYYNTQPLFRSEVPFPKAS